MIYLYGIQVPGEIQQSDYNSLLLAVSQERRERIRSYRFEKDRIRSLFAELLLQYILYRHLSIQDRELSFEKNKFGKPRLSDYPSLFFNYSHAGDWVLCAVGDKPVGVDVEVIGEGSMEIAERFFSKEEYEWLKKTGAAKQKEEFCRLWTRKESYIKMKGKGLAIPLRSFSVLSETSGILKSFSLDDTHLAALCCEDLMMEQEETAVRVITYQELLWNLER